MHGLSYKGNIGIEMTVRKFPCKMPPLFGHSLENDLIKHVPQQNELLQHICDYFINRTGLFEMIEMIYQVGVVVLHVFYFLRKFFSVQH